MRQLVALGAPISLSLLMEYGLFSSAALLMGLIGTAALAAHQVALQVTAILFMVPLGIGMAATVRVGHAVGRRDADAVRRAGYVALGLGTVLAIVFTILVVVYRVTIAELFFGHGATSADTIPLTAALLIVGATYFITDGIQTIVAGALRGLNDTRVPLLMAAISYWLIGFTLACVLGFRTGLGAVGVWIGLSCGTAVYATLLILRFRRLANRFPA
jgi:MATE family multidrug resistance protein